MRILSRSVSLLLVIWITSCMSSSAAARGPFRCEFVAQSSGFPEGIASGSFVCTGIVRDTGACIVEYSVAADGSVAATKTLTGMHGTIVMELRGTFVPTGQLSAVVPNGRWRVTAGTGAYANLRGRGRFRTRVSFDDQTLQSGHLAAMYVGGAVVD